MKSYDVILEHPERAFPAAVYPLIQKYIGNLRGKKVCVPSSGDNLAAFGFHLLGASVTSCDIAENQLKNAKAVADGYGWDIEFVCQDSMRLESIESGAYDLVYTSNGVHVWIDDLPGMYRNFHRVLKAGGYSIFFETHPMVRPFDQTTYEAKIKKRYEDIGPFDDDPTHDWRTQDFVNAISSAGFVIKEMQEFHSLREDIENHNYLYISEEHKSKYHWPGDTFDWRVNPWAALPQCLCLCSQKEA
jgi:SAM-dependent methyltransferase